MSDRILKLGRQYQPTSYDASYLELTLREDVPLATFDAALRRAALKSGAKILPTKK